MASVKVKQDDLRKLMKERRENAKIGKIESPFAKYNNIGQLSCSICNVIIKNNGLWGSHIAGKNHKENLLKHKKSNTDKEAKNNLIFGVKRKSEASESIEDVKRLKNVLTSPSVEKQTPNSTSLLAGYSSSDESNDDSDHESEKTSSVSAPSNVLPTDFFDSSTSNSNALSSSNAKLEKEENSLVPPNTVETLPEGFFDDPVLDAKARNIEYKDPAEEEWERFQKTIAEETNVSKTIIEEDLEESTLERDIDQIDEQIQQWGRVKNLQSLADDVIQKAPKKDNDNNDSGNTDEELEEDDLLDWRSKGLKKHNKL